MIIFSSDDWASGLRTARHHLASGLARQNRVLLVNSVGQRAPTAASRDIKRAVGKLIAFCRGAVKVPEGLHIYTPVVFPFLRTHAGVKALNGVLLRFCIRRVARRLSLVNPIVFVHNVSFNEVVCSLGEKALVYYSIDDQRSFSGVDSGWFDREESWLLSRADCVIACSEELYEVLSAKKSATYYVPHGVEWSLFRTAVDEEFLLPADMQDIPEPRLGFFGYLTDEWFDFQLIRRIAADHPEWHIVLIGKPAPSTDLESLIPQPNIHYLGPKPFAELPAYTRHFEVGLIPFIINPITIHCNPLKLLEYLSGGLPVVSTDIPEVRKFVGDVHVASSHEEFVSLCEKALSTCGPEARDRRSRAVEAHSWKRRIEQISEIVRENTDGRATASRS